MLPESNLEIQKSCYIIGTTTLSMQCAEILLKNNFSVLGLITEDKVVIKWATEQGIPTHNPKDDWEAILQQTPFDYFFSIINLRIIPSSVLQLARCMSINYHDGPLPRYAGTYATHWAIANQETQYGITWHIMTDKSDAGDILEQEDVEILPQDRSHMLNAKCYEAASRSFERLVVNIDQNTLAPKPQDLGQRTFNKLHDRLPAAGTIRWDTPASEIVAHIYASDFGIYNNDLNSAKLLINEDVYIVKDATVAQNTTTKPAGTLIDITPTSLVVASETDPVALSEFRSIYGDTITIDELVETHQLQIGSQLPVLSQEQADLITTTTQHLVKAEKYWYQRIKEFLPTELPYSHRSSQSQAQRAIDQQQMAIPSALIQEIEKLFPNHDTTEVLLSGLFAYLLRLCDTDSLGLGFVHQEIEVLTQKLPNFFEEIVPLQICSPTDREFDGFLTDITSQLQLVYVKGTFLKEVYERYPQEQLQPPNYPIIIQHKALESPSSSESDYALLISVNESEWTWNFDTKQLSTDIVQTLQSQFLNFLEQILTGDSLPLINYRLINDDDYERLVYQWNETSKSYSSEKCLHHLFEEQVKQTPNATALIWRDQSLTYLELDQRANQLARYLQNNGVQTEDFVGIYLHRSIDMVVGMIATHKVGAAYLPLDPNYPTNRIQFMIEDSEVAFILANEQSTESLPQEIESLVIDLDATREIIKTQSVEPVQSDVDSNNLAYVIYTSGSTGRPKGVMVCHRNVVNFFSGMDDVIRHDPPGVWLAVTSISFDISVLELFYTISRGFSVVLYSDDANIKPQTQYSDVAIDMSLFFFGKYIDTHEGKYQLILDSAKFADENGLSAVWTPERHFHDFGGLYPNPSVLSAGLATITEHIQLRSGSLVSPLHDTIRIAENWSIVDNLSNGRVGISFASGWQPNDFVLAPQNFENRKALMFEQIEEVRHLWKGNSIQRTSPKGETVDLKILPRPIQDDIPCWITAAGNPETFRLAGEKGYNLLTHLLGQTFEVLAEKIAIYRKAWQDANHEGEGHVSLMLHTYVDEDYDTAREVAREPMKAYLRSAVDLVKKAAWSFPTYREMTTSETGEFALEHLSTTELEDVLDFAFERYFETSGLFGDLERGTAILDRCKEIGVDDVACLIDYLSDSDAMATLPYIKELFDIANAPLTSEEDYSIPALIERHQVTHVQSTPSLATMLVTLGNAESYLGKLQQYLVGGEAFPPSLALQLEQLMQGDIINMYGPTETTIWSSTFEIKNANEMITIGRPIANTQLYILDSHHRIVPEGVAGELCIGGEGVVRGYLNRPSLTAERFIADPFSNEPNDRIYRTGDLVRYLPNGQVEYIGRIDNQVKIRGYRIETGEIQAKLGQFPGVQENIVIVHQDSQDNKQLVAYFTLQDQTSPSNAELRQFLAQDLPDYMLPAHYIVLDQMPLLPNGKVNRHALPDVGEARIVDTENYEVAQNSTERELTEIWSSKLDIATIGVNDNFFELGGHSLLAVSVVAEIKERFRVNLPLAIFFKASTIRELAKLIHDEDQDSLATSTLVEIQKGNSDKPPFYCVHAHGGHVLFYYDVANHMGKDQPFYALQAVGVDEDEAPLHSIEEMATRYIADIQRVQPQGPYYLGGDCMGGLIAFEMAQQLQAQGEEVATLILVDTYCPTTHPQLRPFMNNRLYEFSLKSQRIFGYHFKRYLNLSSEEKRRYESEMFEKIKFKTRGLFHKFNGKQSSSDNGDNWSIYDVYAVHDKAVESYKPMSYDGDIILVNASKHVPGVISDEKMGWEPYVEGRIHVEEFPGYFNTGFFEPSVQPLAQILKRLIN